MDIKTIAVGQSVAAYSHGKIVDGLLFTSGITSHDLVTGEVRGGTIAEQTRYSFELLETILGLAGSTLSDLLQVQVFLGDIGTDYAEFDRVYREIVPAPYPPRATVGAILPGYKIEMLVTARAHEVDR